MDNERYIRQSKLKAIGGSGQDILATSRIAVVGAGGLASPLLFALAGAGIGYLTIIDYDKVSISNLNRQFLYKYTDIGKSKVRITGKRLREYRPDLNINLLQHKITYDNAEILLSGHDLLIAAVDNISTRYIINKAACDLDLRWIDAGVKGFHGYMSYHIPGKSSCYACRCGPDKEYDLNATNSDTIEKPSVLGTIPAVLGAMQANLAVELLLGINKLEAGTMLLYDGLGQKLDHLSVKRDPNCPVCGSSK